MLGELVPSETMFCKWVKDFQGGCISIQEADALDVYKV